jgi:hypothetical protein
METSNQPQQKPTLEQKMIPQTPVVKDTSPLALRELIEKNLKWSQILYEQNRRINRKLLWTAFARWLQVIVTIVAIGLGIWYAPRWATALQKDIKATILSQFIQPK